MVLNFLHFTLFRDIKYLYHGETLLSIIGEAVGVKVGRLFKEVAFFRIRNFIIFKYVKLMVKP